MIVIECEQGSPEWHAARAGAITASNFSEVRKRLKSGKNEGDFTTAGHNYAFKLAVERINGRACDYDTYETYAMRRGKELEAEARYEHERRIGSFIEQAGVALTDDRCFGFSTDGFIGDDGVSEYKCFTDGSKVRAILFGGSDEEVIDQVQGGLWITGRKWCDFCLYYPDLASRGLGLTIRRIYRDEEYIEKLVANLLEFNGLVEEYIRMIDELAEAERAKVFDNFSDAVEAAVIDEAQLEDIF